MKQAHFRVLASLLFAFGILGACAEIGEMQKALPDNIQNIFINPVEDKTNQADLVQMFNTKIPQTFVDNGRLKVVADKSTADAVLTETLQRYDLIVLRRDTFQAPVTYRMQIMMDVDLTDAKSGNVLITTRRTVQLTPTPSPDPNNPNPATNASQFDSSEVRTLLEFTNYNTVNSLGLVPEDLSSAQQRLSDQMVQRIISLIVDDSSNPVVGATPTPDPSRRNPLYIPAR